MIKDDIFVMCEISSMYIFININRMTLRCDIIQTSNVHKF